jgi:hypothetical protein
VVVEGREKCGDGLCGRSFVVPWHGHSKDQLEGPLGTVGILHRASSGTVFDLFIFVTEWFGSGCCYRVVWFWWKCSGWFVLWRFPLLVALGGNVLVVILLRCLRYCLMNVTLYGSFTMRVL